MQFLCVETDTPVLLFDEDGSLVYSPVNKIRNQSSGMERRIKEMKEKRENLSPTGKKLNFIYSWTCTNSCHLYCYISSTLFLLCPLELFSYLTFLETFPYLDSKWKCLIRNIQIFKLNITCDSKYFMGMWSDHWNQTALVIMWIAFLKTSVHNSLEMKTWRFELWIPLTWVTLRDADLNDARRKGGACFFLQSGIRTVAMSVFGTRCFVMIWPELLLSVMTGPKSWVQIFFYVIWIWTEPRICELSKLISCVDCVSDNNIWRETGCTPFFPCFEFVSMLSVFLVSILDRI